MRPSGLALAILLLAAPPAHAAGGDARGRALALQFVAAYQHAAMFEARMDVLTIQGKDSSEMAVDMVYAKPHSLALTILDAKQFPMANGTTVTWLGGRRARVSTHFYGLPLGITVPVDDPRICNLRGYSMAQVDPAAELPILTDPATRLRYLGESRNEGHGVAGFEVKSNRLLRGIDREVLWVDARTHFPVIREMYEGGQVVYRVAFSQVNMSPHIAPTLFARF